MEWTVTRLRGREARRALEAMEGNIALGLFHNRKLRGVATYYPATHGDPSCLVCGVAVSRRSRQNGSLKLLAALKKAICQQKRVIGSAFFLLADSESTAGERLCNLAAKWLGCPVIDLGLLDRLAEGKPPVAESGIWQKLI